MDRALFYVPINVEGSICLLPDLSVVFFCKGSLALHWFSFPVVS